MRVITGGAGFIGSMLAKEMNLAGIKDIIIVDTLGDKGKWKNIQNIEFIDIWTPESFFARAKNISIIYHLGACSSTTIQDGDFLLENNYRYSQRIFEFCALKQIPLVYASSAATYGMGEFGYDDDHHLLKDLRPLNPYGFSKKIFDDWVIQQVKKDLKPPMWFGIKFFNVFGPNEYHKENMTSVVFKAFHQLIATKKVKLFESYKKDIPHGEQKRDFIYVKDATKALLQLETVTNPLRCGIYNLGTGIERSFNDLVKATMSALEMQTTIDYIPMPQELRSQYQYWTKANMKKFHVLFPQFTFSTLEDSISDYVKEYLLPSINSNNI